MKKLLFLILALPMAFSAFAFTPPAPDVGQVSKQSIAVAPDVTSFDFVAVLTIPEIQVTDFDGYVNRPLFYVKDEPKKSEPTIAEPLLANRIRADSKNSVKSPVTFESWFEALE